MVNKIKVIGSDCEMYFRHLWLRRLLPKLPTFLLSAWAAQLDIPLSVTADALDTPLSQYDLK